MSYRNSEEERDQVLKKLDTIKRKAIQGTSPRTDYIELILIVKDLVERSYERDIQLDKADKVYEEFVNSNEWDILND